MKNVRKSFMAGIMFLAILTAANATPVNITPIYGSGNLPQGWTASDAGGTQVAVRGKNSTTGATPMDGSGNYLFNPGQLWNADFHFYSGTAPLSSYTYTMQITGPGIVLNTPFSPTVYGDNSYGNLATPNGGGVEGLFATYGSSNSVMQLSQKITFPPFSGSFANEGMYTLSASIWSNNELINTTSANVFVGTVPDSGASAMLLAGGLLGLFLVRKFGLPMFGQINSA